MVGRLNLSVYGARDAAQNSQSEFIESLVGSGFVKGKSSPLKFHHASRQLHLIVHGDGSTTIGPTTAPKWFQHLLDERYECKRKVLVPDDGKTARVFNRMLIWDADGNHHEVDQRHVELIAQQLKLEEAKAVVIFGTREEQCKAIGATSRLMSPQEASAYRMTAARPNYLAFSRPGVQHAIKEIAKHVSKRQGHHWRLLGRLGRYLEMVQRFVQKFERLRKGTDVIGHRDSDCVGDLTARKRTSSGICMIGAPVADAELYELIKCACQCIGATHIAAGFGLSARAVVMAGAGAALGIYKDKSSAI